jgi:DNA (cytosine-5)-methyltransferase 1
MKHIDLFSGIGGFSLACDWAGIETVCFCEIDSFCQKVLKRHWPDVPIVKDVNNVEETKQVIANARGTESRGIPSRKWEKDTEVGDSRGLLLTAGFPCQPFSAAGRRKGSADSRYLWPQTLAVIEAVKPDWVLLENVAGILSMVFPDSGIGVASQASLFNTPNDEIADHDTISGRIDRDLRQAGYETVWLVIPACAVNAPHRRDRVWIVAHANVREQRANARTDNGTQEDIWRKNKGNVHSGQIQYAIAHASDNGCDRDDSASGMEGQLPTNQEQSGNRRASGNQGCDSDATQSQSRESREPPKPEGREDISRGDSEGGDVADSSNEGLQGNEQPSTYCSGFRQCESSESVTQCDRVPAGWAENWYEVATRFCRVDDEFSHRMDRNRVNRLKALGNAIVPAVALEIIKAIKEADQQWQH